MSDGIHDHLGIREIVRLDPDTATAWVNPLAPMSPNVRDAVQTLANYASALTKAHRELLGDSDWQGEGWKL